MRTVYFCVFALALTSFVAALVDPDAAAEAQLDHDIATEIEHKVGFDIGSSKSKTCDQQSALAAYDAAKIGRQCF